jgi:hypothetical protein
MADVGAGCADAVAEACAVGLAEVADAGLEEVRATGAVPQPTRNTATVNVAAVAPIRDLMPV